MINYIKSNHLSLLIIAFLAVSSLAGDDGLGAPRALTTFTNPITFDQEITVNESGVDRDTRIEGDTEANLLYVDAGNDCVAIGASSCTNPLEVTGAFSNTGLFSADGGFQTGSSSISTTTTLTTANCGDTVVFNDSDGGSTVTLPAATSDGCNIAFVVGTAFGTANIIIASAEGDNIEGLLQVNAADVACSGEDQINVVNSAETVGDRVSLYAAGGSWYIMDGAADAAGALTCTDPS